MSDALVDSYLKGESLSAEEAKKKKTSVVWYGTCERNDSAVVKELCSASDDEFRKTMWDPVRKLWGTTRLENVVSLIASGLWSPLGLPPSKKEAVAVGAKRIIDCKLAKERERIEEEERKEEEAREKRAQEAMQKERERQAKEDAASVFSDADAQEAWEKYGLSREILDVSRSFAWLGPLGSSPMVRIHRWFRFTHNREAGPRAVVEKDFEPAYRAFLDARRESTVAAKGPSTKKRKVENVEAPTFEELKQREERRVKEIQDRIDAEKTDEHALALKAIVAKCKNMPPRVAPYARECPMCGVKPLEQFLDCGCHDEKCMSWTVCELCNCIWNASKLACLCKA